MVGCSSLAVFTAVQPAALQPRSGAGRGRGARAAWTACGTCRPGRCGGRRSCGSPDPWPAAAPGTTAGSRLQQTVNIPSWLCCGTHYLRAGRVPGRASGSRGSSSPPSHSPASSPRTGGRRRGERCRPGRGGERAPPATPGCRRGTCSRPAPRTGRSQASCPRWGCPAPAQGSLVAK